MKITEQIIENQAIEQLQQLGWQYLSYEDFCQQGWRERLQEVVLLPLLRAAVERLNPHLPQAQVEEVLKLVSQGDIIALADRNKQAYQWLKFGVAVKYQQNGEQKQEFVRLIDFELPENNHWLMVNQFEVVGNKGKRIPDLVGFINGLPVLVFEFKNPVDVRADLSKAFNQLQTYKNELPDLFVFNQGLVVSDGTTARFGSLTADWERFAPWRVVDEKNRSRRLPFADEQQGLIEGLFAPENWLNYMRSFIVFEQNSKGQTIKKSAAYHQFYGVNEAVECTIATMASQSNKIGVVWHTQGSGKSLSMLFYAGKLMSQPELKNPTIVVVTDRNDLDGQLMATFSAGKDLLRQHPIQANDREQLREELSKRETGGVIFTTIQKFALLGEELRHPILNARRNIVVISDEAHRSQYGFAQSINDEGKYRVGYAKHLRDALPNAAFIGFTGTPISLEDKDTQEVFGQYVSIYDIADAVEDGATVPIIYEARQVQLHQSAEAEALLAQAEKIYNEDEEEKSPKFRYLAELMGTEKRLKALSEDLVEHFEKRNELSEGKAMVVALSREICVKLYNQITALRPDWHSDNIHQGAIKIMMTGSAGDPDFMQPHIYSFQDKKTIEKRFKDPDDPLKIVIVRDMWLTGFDAPCCHTMYIDKPMQGHNLMQAIARVNRVFRNKSHENGGLIVDYVGLVEELKKATQQYTNAGGKSAVKTDIELVFQKMLENLDIARQQLLSPVNGKTINPQTTIKLTDSTALLNAIRQAADHILALDLQHTQKDKANANERRNAFLNAVRQAKKGFTLCRSYPAAAKYEQELAFYDAVRATIVKNSHNPSSYNPKERQLKLTALLNQAVQSDGVVDLFDLIEQQHPNISILSDEFLNSVKQSNSPNLWASAIERYLSSQIKQKAEKNLKLQKNFSEKLKQAMNEYHNRNLSVMEIIEELIKLAKELEQELAKGKKLGLNSQELAFYDALSNNQSAVEQMQPSALIALAKEITAQLRKSVTIDWQHKQSVRAKMRVLVRRALLKYKYPPDQQAEAVEFVLEQAEQIAGDLSVNEGDVV